MDSVMTPHGVPLPSPLQSFDPGGPPTIVRVHFWAVRYSKAMNPRHPSPHQESPTLVRRVFGSACAISQHAAVVLLQAESGYRAARCYVCMTKTLPNAPFNHHTSSGSSAVRRGIRS